MSRKSSALIAAVALAILAGAAARIVAAQSPAPNADTPASNGGTAAPGAPERTPLPQVTVSAQRAALQPKISAFVQKIGGSIYAEGIARWQDSVCPLVSGLPPADGEFILGRVSEIARAASVPLAGEKCRANLYILVSNQPAELLKGMDKRNHPFTFGSASPGLVDQFISTPRPVRVWYHTVAKSPEGLPLQSLSYPNIESIAAGPNGDTAKMAQLGPSVTDTGAPTMAHGTVSWAHDTHLSFNVTWGIYRVFVIVDQTRLQGLSREQVADYVAMVGLAQLRDATPPPEDPTILRLFEGTPQQAAPAAMTDWDQAFLKSLYLVEQKSKLQRSQIGEEMVREIVH